MKILIALLLTATAAMAEPLQSDRPAPGMWRLVERLQVPPFEPNEEMKKRALRRAYELNNSSMCCGSIDVGNDPAMTGRTVITPETEFNVLDAATKKKRN